MEAVKSEIEQIEELNVISDIFSQAITGELIGMSNFASLAETIDDPHKKIEAVEHDQYNILEKFKLNKLYYIFKSN